MASSFSFGCKYCGQVRFSSQNALNQHQRHGLCARAKEREEAGESPPGSPMSLASDAHEQYVAVPVPPQKPAILRVALQGIARHDIDEIALDMGDLLADAGEDEASESPGHDDDFVPFADDVEQDGPDSDLSASSDEKDSGSSSSESDSSPNESDSGVTSASDSGPDTTMRDQFRAYCAHANTHFLELTGPEKVSIKLLHLLKSKNTSLNAYESVMLWHLKSSNKIREDEKLGAYAEYIGRKTILNSLQKRYNFENKMPFQKTIKLPVSGTVVKVTCHDTLASIQRLLTDPRIKPKDYLFWDRNPLQGPPENLDYVKDLNTGRAFLQTYTKLITKEGQQLLPVIIYSDGTAVSHFHDMELIQVKIALGIYTREARINAYCWVPLGYIEKVHEQGGRGKKILVEANHLETQDGNDSDANSSGMVEGEGVGDKNDQDFHAMMALILEDYVALQKDGFLWDFHDQETGKTWQNIQYIPFVPFLRVDGKEADLLCAKYGQRSSTQQICRKCHCPLKRADDHLAKYKLKTVSEIKKLVEKADINRLRELSQTYLKNAFYNVRFSEGNDYGIHGCCPSELLHAFLLGTFKYLRDIFFEMIGRTSEGAKLINALAKIYGKMFARQSDRTMPGTAFSRGIQAGKLMAKDYRGVLLIMLAIVRSTKGRNILRKNKNFSDKDETALDDWILLIELMLEWESYLNEPLMYVKHVKRLEKKHRYIMYVMRRVAQRTKGMGLKLLKFHMILHIWEDILEFGVPLEFDTSPNESMHKPAKQASKLTQRAAETFNFQTATRLCEFELLDLAMLEIEEDRRIWDYFTTFGPESSSDSESQGSSRAKETFTGETRIQVYTDDEGETAFKLITRSKVSGNAQWNSELVDFLFGLQEIYQTWKGQDSLPIFTCHRRDGQIFRGHPNYRGKGPWRDWVWVNWGQGFGKTPCHIWCFVVISGAPAGRNRVHYGGIPVADGTYAVVETTALEEDEDEMGRSDLMMPVRKEIQLDGDDNVVGRSFYLADTEAFCDPCCTVPDLGGPTNRYFVVKPRNQWSQEFIRWVQDEHNRDSMDPIVEVDEDDEIMEGLEQDRPQKGRKSA